VDNLEVIEGYKISDLLKSEQSKSQKSFKITQPPNNPYNVVTPTK